MTIILVYIDDAIFSSVFFSASSTVLESFAYAFNPFRQPADQNQYCKQCSSRWNGA